MMRGTIYLERVDRRDPEIPTNPHIGWVVLTRDVPNAAAFATVVRDEYSSPGVEVSFGPIGKPWT
jgi:hypothetical protein